MVMTEQDKHPFISKEKTLEDKVFNCPNGQLLSLYDDADKMYIFRKVKVVKSGSHTYIVLEDPKPDHRNNRVIQYAYEYIGRRLVRIKNKILFKMILNFPI